MITATSKEEVILHVAGVGGGYTILGELHHDIWRFWRSTVSGDSNVYDLDEVCAAPTLDEPLGVLEAAFFGTLDEALARINSDWPRLHPIDVHPTFAKDIGDRVALYLANNRVSSPLRVISEWREFCPMLEIQGQ